MMLKGIRAVSFDAMNTLIHPKVPVGLSYARQLKETAGLHVPMELLNDHFRLSFARWSNSHSCYGFNSIDSEKWWSHVAVDCCKGALKDVGMENFITGDQLLEVSHNLFLEFSHKSAWDLAEQLESTLKTLMRRGIQPCIVSNFDVRLRQILDEFRLLQYFTPFVVLSGEVGVEKPNAEIFALLQGQLGSQAEAIVHVGDDLNKDFNGAKLAGCQSLLIANKDKCHKAGLTAYDCVDKLSHIVERI